ncbi:LuxR family transcriptional regulator [Photobacterium gaetbulicola]|uniref:Putative LuxR family transcriptional regulator n=1 Tax=Photobacterium gaetbulicola Gung47 TaxID=658445 RepID=A0A0C5WKR1_9GAMM|nr:LuxR family transcriptional regulator [Photobacterium gaetbulicola]AJR05689.1 putative LuxR family transcriptional regulator [Photobacterium gaetbulicola Gung47]PSU14663.1 LuxR family transcriptional regulator [Photobacterium gaetbulicola]
MNAIILYKLISKLEKASSESELRSICEQLCKSTEIPFYLMGVISHKSLCNPNFNIITNHNTESIKAFYNKNKLAIDPIILKIMSQSSPVRWEKLLDNQPHKNKNFMQLVKDANELGLKNGLSIPFRSGKGEVGIMCLGVDNCTHASVKQLNKILPYAHTFSMHLFETFRSLLSIESVQEPETELTNREKECLFWVCEGKTTWEIAQILKITERTVGFHLNNSATKLGACNRQHTVAIAISKGLIQPKILDINIDIAASC